MAAKDRRKAPGRIAVLAATGIASATFLFAIVNTPTSTSSQAAVQAASLAQVSSATQPVSPSTTVSQTSSAQTSSTQTTTSTARFRTRAS